MNDIETAVAGCEAAEAILRENGTGNFAKNIEMANILCSLGRYADGAKLFRESCRVNPYSKHALLAALEAEMQAGFQVPEQEVDKLFALDSDFARYFQVKQKKAAGTDASKIIEVMENAFEGFETGSSADWIYLRAAAELYPNAHIPETPAATKPKLFFYWDKDVRPDEVDRNIEHHRGLGIFDVQPFSKAMAIDFLYKFFGQDTAKLFQTLRHPSEESDFFRFHAIYAMGGYYLDVDECIVSAEAFQNNVGRGVIDTYVLADSGPIQSAFFGAPAASEIIGEALRVLIANCYLRPDLSMWLKTGPGPITRALSRTYYRHFRHSTPLPKFRLLPADTFPKMLSAVPVSYRNDDRDWRVYEANRNKLS